MVRSNRKSTATCALALLIALASPLAATTDTAGTANAKPKPVVVIETADLTCWQAPPVCNCKGADHCEVLKTSGYCKDTTFNFWKDENLGTCIWNGTK